MVVEGRMDAVEQMLVANRQAAADESAVTHTLLADVLKSLGHPQDGQAQPATGLYWAIETVSERVKPFERLWEQVKGSFKTVAVLALPVAALLWFLAGDKLTQLFHG